ncbi:MAG: transporter substrate-binding domain-containing protein [Clostridiales bacterium]|nr:transporter substrate-binding domain-containing protein [Clostridiales bacterium]
MKKIYAFLMILVIMAISLAAAAEGDLLQQIQERGRLIIATEGNWSPWTYHDENDKLTGFDIEVGTLIAESLGVAPDFKEAAWDAILTGVDNRVFDIACNGVGYTEERAESYAFSDPYVYTEVALVVRKDNEDIHTFEDLAGKKTANSPNSTYAQRAEAVGAEVTYVDTLGETMALLTQGRVDATINAKDSVNDYLSEHPDANIKIVLTVPGEKVCYPMKKGGETDTLVAAVNEALAKAREDGTLAALSVKYFGQDLTNPE